MFDVREYEGGMFGWERKREPDPTKRMKGRYWKPSTPEALNARRQVTQTCSLFTRLYRVLSGNPKLLVNDMSAALQYYGNASAPAMSTDDGRIYIDFTHKAFRECYGERAFAHSLGLGYHELAHRLYTPEWIGSWATRMSPAVSLRNGRIAYNILEDGRIERLLSTEYGAIHAYLVITFMTITDYESNPESTWLITAPRASRLDPYLVDLLREAARSSETRALSDDLLDETLDICNAYNRLVLPRDYAQASVLVTRYAQIISDMQTDMSKQGATSAVQKSQEVLSGRHDESAATQHTYPDASEGTAPVKQRTEAEQDAAQREADRREEEQRKQVSAASEQPEGDDADEDEADEQAAGSGGTDDEAEDDADESDATSGDSDASDDDEDADEDYSGSGGGAGEDEDADGDPEDGDSSGSGSDSDSAGSGDDGDSDGDGGGKGEGGTEDRTGSDGTGAGGGSGDLDYGDDQDDRYDPEDLRDAIAEAVQQDMDAALNSDTVKEDLRGHRAALSSGRNFVSTALPYAPTKQLPITAEDRAIVRRLSRLFERLTHQLEPGWETHTAAGKFNALRFVRDEDASTAYDLWHEDRTDAANVEVALCIDVSGSMGSRVYNADGGFSNVQRIDAAARTAHILRLVVQSFGGKVTGLGYDSVTRLMFTGDERAKTDSYPSWEEQGGTHVVESLCQAQLLMRASRAAGKVVIVVSDGDFSDQRESVEDMCNALRGEGAHVLRFLIGVHPTAIATFEQNDEYHNCFDLSAAVRDPIDMVEPIQQLIQRLIKEAGKIA